MGKTSKDAPKINDRVFRFCQEYIIDLHGGKAAERAGFSKSGAHTEASRLLKNEEVIKIIQKLMNKRSKRVEVSADDVLRETWKIASSDLKDAYDEDGQLLPVNKMPDNIRGALAGVDIYKDFTEGAEIGETKKLKLWDKLKALELMGKHLKMFGSSKEGGLGGSLEGLVAGAQEEKE